MVNQHLTCVNESTFMPICIAYYVNTYMYKCTFWGRGGGFLHGKNWKNLIGTVQWSGTERCQSMHLYIFRTPFHWWWPISTCSAVVQLKLYFKVQLFFFFFFFLSNCYVVKRYSHHVEDTGRPFLWILYFFTFCHSKYHVLYFWIRLSRRQSWHDKRNFNMSLKSTRDLTANCAYVKKKKKNYKWNVTIEFHDPCTCISNDFWTFLCEAHI